jgi:hypothetical protein
MCLTSRFLFLTFQEGIERYAVDRVDLKSDSWDVSHAFAFSAADAFDMDLIVFIDEVESSVAGQERCDDFSVLYQLNSDGLAYSTVRLTAFNANLLENYSSALRGSLKWVRLVVESKHATFVRWVMPSESLVPALRLSSGQ